MTVKLYAGHKLLEFNVSIINEQNTVTHVVISAKQTNVSSGIMNYTIFVPFSKSGNHRFAVSASNPFGKSAMKSDVFPINGLEGNKIILTDVSYLNPGFIIVIMPSIIPTVVSTNGLPGKYKSYFNKQ